jgi:3',5'-cyclic AMP phosphodiesterase CpdA
MRAGAPSAWFRFVACGGLALVTAACTEAPVAGFRPGVSVDPSGFELVGAPLVFAPTANGFSINVALRFGDPLDLRARVRDLAYPDWTEVGRPTSPAPDVAQWSVGRLAPGRSYELEIRVAAAKPADDGPHRLLYAGRALTAPVAGTPFSFALITDSHIPPRSPLPDATDVSAYIESTLASVAADVRTVDPDFVIDLGDTLDFHEFGFNDPPPDSSWTRLGYLNYRRVLGDTLRRAAHFPVVGNWDGETGCFTTEEIERSRSQRLLYLPGPDDRTYAEGGSPTQDYYAFTWGDALFVVLNVMTYTPTCHRLSDDSGLPDDWTLGAAQLAWLDRTLAGATSKWRFLFIHHTVGGAAGDFENSAYGRGGGQAAAIGEQAVIHDMMRRYGVQVFFYGHDHVFTDMVVDGIHYTLPGSAGAPWKFVEGETGYQTFWPDSGFARVQVAPDSVQVDFVPMGGGAPLFGYTLQ